ncbi:MAG: M42 family metallopeptidase [Candidatus Neomarinimicrobiota bacterium]|nr:M42 family metallopeptidase [Candidatus Neomarinimicrobiota bacterium]MDX9781111.1 M42 family metallopeptidase [bacterium]
MSMPYIRELIAIPSPSGDTDAVIEHIEKRLASLPYHIFRSYRGSLIVNTVPDPDLMIMAHIDTLGGMVSEIRENGTLRLSQIGGWPPNSFEGEYVTVICMDGRKYRGTFLVDNPAAHVNKDVKGTERIMANMHVRLDALLHSKDDVKKLGISVGDFVAFDPRTELTENGFLKSRFIDDKACSGILLDILINEQKKLQSSKTGFYFSAYEEVGNGCPSGLPQSIKDVLIADMGVVGDGVTGEETRVSICAKDSAGPYDLGLRRQLEELARKGKIEYAVDVFPYYSSDGSALLRAGRDIRVALIGPGVSASHGVERTHKRGIEATRALILALIASRNKKG